MKTIDEIVREMRKDMPRVGDTKVILRNYADRIEAAHKREQSVTDCNQQETVDIDSRCIYGEVKEVVVAKTETTTPTCKESLQVGNAAKMREALEAVVKVGYPHNFQREAPHIRGYCYEITTAIEKCFAALSDPARNCDRFKTKEEAALAYAEECNAFIPQSILWQIGEWLNWLFAEAKGE